jgi:hypothetical protein
VNCEWPDCQKEVDTKTNLCYGHVMEVIRLSCKQARDIEDNTFKVEGKEIR